MGKIVSLRGCSGAGKSTVVFNLLNAHPHEPVLDEKGKIEGYRIDVAGLDEPVYVVGRYTTACGGCDTVPTQADIVHRVKKYHALGGHVLFEGLLMSGAYGTVGKLAEDFPQEHVFATLDTPLDKCLQRVQQRRAAKGNDKPLNPANTESKFHATRSCHTRVLGMGHKAVMIDHTRADEQIMALLTGAL